MNIFIFEPFAKTKKKNCATMSQLFAPFRAIGVVSDDVACAVATLGREHFVTTAVGTAFHVYEAKHLRLKIVGENTPCGRPVRALAAWRQLTFVAAGNRLYTYSRGKIVRSKKKKKKNKKKKKKNH
jgi:U3 small nucleolar RNA-associated protein 21